MQKSYYTRQSLWRVYIYCTWVCACVFVFNTCCEMCSCSMPPLCVNTCIKLHSCMCFGPLASPACKCGMFACTRRTSMCAHGQAPFQRVCGSSLLQQTTPAVRLAGSEIWVFISALPPAKQTSCSLLLSGSGWWSTSGLPQSGERRLYISCHI